MKTLFLKNGMPIATAVLAMAGAFATTSMQSTSSSSAFAPVVGYTLNAQGECDIAALCSNVPSSRICRLFYPNGPIAVGKTPQGNCFYTLWKFEGV